MISRSSNSDGDDQKSSTAPACGFALAPGKAASGRFTGRPTMKRFRDYSIKSRLYGLVAVSTVGFLVVLGLTAWLFNLYRINGPLHDRIRRARMATAEVEPPTLYVLD